MRILAVDTTGAHGSVAFLDGEELEGIVGIRKPRARHAENLLLHVDELLSRLGRTLEDVDGYSVARGPGSFTGLRIGIAAVVGLAFAAGRPRVGVSTLEATAYRFRHAPGLLVSFLEAYRGEIYGAAYRSRGDAIVEVVGPVCEPPDRFLDSLPESPAVVAGTGLLRYRDMVSGRFPDAAIADASFFLAEEVARLGAARIEEARIEEGSRALEPIEALYIRPSDAERDLARKAESR